MYKFPYYVHLNISVFLTPFPPLMPLLAGTGTKMQTFHTYTRAPRRSCKNRSVTLHKCWLGKAEKRVVFQTERQHTNEHAYYGCIDSFLVNARAVRARIIAERWSESPAPANHYYCVGASVLTRSTEARAIWPSISQSAPGRNAARNRVASFSWHCRYGIFYVIVTQWQLN